MERFYKSHPGLIFFIGVIASIAAYAVTNIDTKADVDKKVESVKELSRAHYENIEKRLDRIETKIDNLQGEKK